MFKRLFHSKQERLGDGAPGSDVSESPTGCAPGTSITYDGDLIARFKGHHKILLKLHGAIREAAVAHHFADVTSKLAAFRRVLDQHLLEEHLRLYIYLRKCVEDAESAERVTEMRIEMGRIGRSVREFTGHYADNGVDEDNVTAFLSALDDMGAVLGHRIEREESALYPLYRPPNDYEDSGDASRQEVSATVTPLAETV